MARKPTWKELEQKIRALDKDLCRCRAAEKALKDYTAFQSVLAVLRGIKPEQSEKTLLQALLSEVVAQYGFCMAWYGRHEDGQIRPVVSAGRVDQYLDGLVLKIKEPESPDACCAMSRAVLDEAPFTYGDLENDEGFQAWRDYALELGYRSNLALPFKVDHRIEGGIMVYADTPQAFPDERIGRLELLATEAAAIIREWRLKAMAVKAMDQAYEILETQVTKRTVDLKTANDRLTQEIEAHKQVQYALQESETKYSTLVEHANVGVVILRDQTFEFANNALADITGYPVEKLLGMHFLKLVVPAYWPLVEERYKAGVAGKPVPSTYEIEIVCRDGTTKNLELSVSRIGYQGRPATMAIVGDITPRKQREEALRKKDAELQLKTKNLEEVNTALRVLLKEREKDKTDIEEKVLSNIKDLVTPYLERLKKTSLDGTQKSCVDILESNLKEIVSPFSKKLSSKFLGLTPTEIQVANLVKDGKTSKEIAEFMILSAKTVEFHRDNIRNKLGIKNKGVNLRTHLQSL